MFSIGDCRIRMEDILTELDALADAVPEAAAESFEDLNAELEDELLSLSEIRTDAGDWRDEVRDMMEDLRALAGDYRVLAGMTEGVSALADRIEAVCDQALSGL